MPQLMSPSQLSPLHFTAQSPCWQSILPLQEPLSQVTEQSPVPQMTSCVHESLSHDTLHSPSWQVTLSVQDLLSQMMVQLPDFSHFTSS